MNPFKLHQGYDIAYQLENEIPKAQRKSVEHHYTTAFYLGIRLHNKKHQFIEIKADNTFLIHETLEDRIRTVIIDQKTKKRGSAIVIEETTIVENPQKIEEYLKLTANIYNRTFENKL